MWNPTHVQVTVHRTKGLIAKGKNGTNDTYVTILLGKDKYQTSVKEKSKNPEWHEECDLLIPDKPTDIELNVFHRNLLGLDQFLGHVSLPLNEFQIYERPRSRWYTLRNKPDSKKPQKSRGEIEVKVTFIVQSVASSSSTKSSLSSSTLSLNKLGKIAKPSAIKSLAHSVGDRLKHPSRGKSDRRSSELGASPYIEPLASQSSLCASSPDISKQKTKSHQGLPGILPTYPTFSPPTESRDAYTEQHAMAPSSDQLVPSFAANEQNAEHRLSIGGISIGNVSITSESSAQMYSDDAGTQELNSTVKKEEEPPSPETVTTTEAANQAKQCRVAQPMDSQMTAQSMLNLSTASSNQSVNSSSSGGTNQKMTEQEIKREAKFSGSAIRVITRREAPQVDDGNDEEPERVSRIISPVKDAQSVDITDNSSALDEPEESDHSLYGRGRFSSEPLESVRRSLSGETSPLRILPEETTVEPSSPAAVDPPSEQQEYWSSSAEQQRVASTETTPVKMADPITGNGHIGFPVETTNMPMSAMPDTTLDFQRLKKTKGDDFRRHTLHYGVREAPKAPAHELFKGITEYKKNAEEEQTIPDEVMAPYTMMSKEELIRLVCSQRQQQQRDAAYISEMENYLDSLLVKVIETAPKILQNPYDKTPTSPKPKPATKSPTTIKPTQTVVPPPTPQQTENKCTVPPRVTTHSRKATKPVALKSSKKAIANPFKKISAAIK